VNKPRARRGRRIGSVALVAGLAAFGACGDSEPRSNGAGPGDPGPIHVHGLGIDPADDALFIATHTGLFRAAAGEIRAQRVANRYQDTMGFAVVGPNRFLGSGHPDGRESLPPFLGLIASRDAGRSWTPVSLQGDVDFHVLEASGDRIYGYGSDFDSREARFLTSGDGGRSWQRLAAPEPLLSLAIAPSNPDEVVASGEQRIFRSRDAGESWRPVDTPAAGRLAWNDRGLFLVAADGRVWRAESSSSPWSPKTAVDGEPAAWDAGPRDQLLVGLHDGTVKLSTDGASTWTVRSRPG
jgi:hypothetical protein